ncbi:hypothetical protein T484DRAFT_1867394 [Baffinella frigidus]|nr:hypothetical protein T484DRAFT_1867394 [Cryptophyta sp. CCMP2293]
MLGRWRAPLLLACTCMAALLEPGTPGRILLPCMAGQAGPGRVLLLRLRGGFDNFEDETPREKKFKADKARQKRLLEHQQLQARQTRVRRAAKAGWPNPEAAAALTPQDLDIYAEPTAATEAKFRHLWEDGIVGEEEPQLSQLQLDALREVLAVWPGEDLRRPHKDAPAARGGDFGGAEGTRELGGWSSHGHVEDGIDALMDE